MNRTIYSFNKRPFFVCLLSILGLAGPFQSAHAQLVYTESFEHVISGGDYNIPPWWVQAQIGVSVDVDNKFYCSNIATFPSITARTGTDLLGFNAKDIISGESSFI